MKSRILSLTVVLGLILSGCSNNEAPTAGAISADIQRTVKEIAITDGTPVTFADLSIEGMSCEMMCGGSIKKALAKLPGIEQTEIKFVEGDERDHAIVTYDESKVTDAQMIEAIQGLHDGQYKVLAVEITKQVADGNALHSSIGEKYFPKQLKVNAPSVSVLPSVIALLTQIMKL
ncbi:MAG: hypothetical protein M3R08_00715 [Bacteroidota bacterium]|nr:hypothetical protein [Bacteroidota bacterium]